MNAAERGEQIRWWDALDVLWNSARKGLETARDSQHPDALWFCSLFPSGYEAEHSSMHDVLLAQGDDPRALCLSFCLIQENVAARARLQRAAQSGYAHAQALLAAQSSEEEAFYWAQSAASLGDRRGLYELGRCWCHGTGCKEDRAKAIEAFRVAADWEFENAQLELGEVFGELDWERFYWWGRAASRGVERQSFSYSALPLLPFFESGAHGRILHTVAPLIRRSCSFEEGSVYGYAVTEDTMAKVQRLLFLHGAMLGRAKQAIACWSIAARRHGVVKDIRVVIAKKAWEEVWLWGENGTEGAAQEETKVLDG
jgi:hypothetical protein